MGLGKWYRINMSLNNKGKWCITRHKMIRVSVLKTLYSRCRAVFVVSFLGEGEWMCLGNKVTDGGQLYRVTLHQELVDMERKYSQLWKPPKIKIRVWRKYTYYPTHSLRSGWWCWLLIPNLLDCLRRVVNWSWSWGARLCWWCAWAAVLLALATSSCWKSPYRVALPTLLGIVSNQHQC